MSATWLTAARISVYRGRRLLMIDSNNSSQCSFCSAGSRSVKRKRRRGKLPLAPTKKDRIRSLEPKPEPELTLPSIDLNKVGDTMESRLTQAQEFVWNFWRGETKEPRPERVSLNMDGRWWFWNLMLMSLPGIMIGLYCEFKAKPEMIELLGKLDEEQRARILGDTLGAEEELFAMGQEDVQRLQETVNEELVTNSDDENLTLLALKQRLDALESQVRKKDNQLDHLRRYQLERTQQSGIQNRIEDKMITEWKSQSKQLPVDASDEEANDKHDESLSERMKEAVTHGLGQNLEDKKEALKVYGTKWLDYGRGLLSGEEEPSPSSATLNDDNANSTAEVVKAVSDAASHTNRAAETVSSSVASGDPNEVSQAAKVASEAAAEAARAAQTAANAASHQSTKTGGFLTRQWNRLFRGKEGPKDESADDTPSK